MSNIVKISAATAKHHQLYSPRIFIHFAVFPYLTKETMYQHSKLIQMLTSANTHYHYSNQNQKMQINYRENADAFRPAISKMRLKLRDFH